MKCDKVIAGSRSSIQLSIGHPLIEYLSVQPLRLRLRFIHAWYFSYKRLTPLMYMLCPVCRTLGL